MILAFWLIYAIRTSKWGASESTVNLWKKGEPIFLRFLNAWYDHEQKYAVANGVEVGLMCYYKENFSGSYG